MLSLDDMERYLTPERRTTLMAYCHLAEEEMGPADSDLLTGMAYAAMAELGISIPEDDNPDRYSYDMAINAAVLDSWDRRDAQTEEALTENPAAQRRRDGLGLIYG